MRRSAFSRLRGAPRRTPDWRYLAAIGTLLMGCDRGAAPVTPTPMAVTVATPAAQPVTDYLEFSGNTAATDSVILFARVEGYLEGIHFADGARVHAGDLLFTIQRQQYEAQLQQAQAQVAAQQAALLHAKTELARYSKLVTEDSAPQTQVDRWQYEYDSSEAALRGAQAQVELAKLNLGYTRVTAPFDGRMGRHLVDIGNVVGGVGQPSNLAQIDRVDPLYVYFTIDEQDLLRIVARLTPGPQQPVVEQTIPAAFGLLNETGYPHEGKVDFASLSVAPTTGTLQARAIFPNADPGVLPGLFVRVRVPTGAPHDALLVPGDAIGFDQQGEYVLLVTAADVVERRAVKTGEQVGTNLVVESGLAAGDRVVVEGLAGAMPGRKVRPEPAAPPLTAAPGGTPTPSRAQP